MSSWFNISANKAVAPIDMGATPDHDQKAFAGYGSFGSYLISAGNYDLASFEALRLFYLCKPYYHAVTKRSYAFSAIEPRVWDVKQKEFVDDHPVINRLKHPNPFQSYEAWACELSEYFDVVGNSFVLATGRISAEPLELYVERPQNIDLEEGDQTFYFADKIRVSRRLKEDTFLLDIVRQDGVRTARYFNGRDAEIWQIREPNLSYYRAGLWGVARSQAIWLEIQQFIESNVNNLSILQKGGRPSMIWKWLHDQPMTDSQFQRARHELKKYEGALNAGRQVISDNIEPVPVGMTQKDMQFSENRSTVMEDIYSIYDVPLALISSKSMTLDNLKTSELLFWNDSVLPLASQLFGELTRFLLPRYGDFQNRKPQDLKITFNPFDISVLEQAKIRQTADLAKIGILTDNELRADIGFEGYEGGDVIFKPVNLLPAGTDNDTSNNLTEPLTKSSEFLDKLMNLRRVDGSKVFDEAELDNYQEGKA